MNGVRFYSIFCEIYSLILWDQETSKTFLKIDVRTLGTLEMFLDSLMS